MEKKGWFSFNKKEKGLSEEEESKILEEIKTVEIIGNNSDTDFSYERPARTDEEKKQGDTIQDKVMKRLMQRMHAGENEKSVAFNEKVAKFNEQVLSFNIRAAEQNNLSEEELEKLNAESFELNKTQASLILEQKVLKDLKSANDIVLKGDRN